MTAYVFTDDRAAAVCQRYASDVDLGNHSERNRRRRDVAGFWAVLRSQAGQDKLAVQPSPTAGGLSPEGAYQTQPERIG